MDHNDTLVRSAHDQTWLEVDLAKIRSNVECLRRTVGTRVLFVVKADGFGHGMEHVASAGVKGGASFLGVTSLSEAERLRHFDRNASVLIMGPVFDSEAEIANRIRSRWVVWREEHLQAADAAGRLIGAPSVVHVKADVGMSRFGAELGRVPKLLRLARSMQGIQVEGLCTHLPSSDDEQKSETTQQLASFADLVHALEVEGLRPPLVHAANSAGALRFEQSRLDMVRCGLAAYGLSPSEAVRLPNGLAPAIRWQARFVEVREVERGRPIGYNAGFVAAERMRIGVLGLGYVHGFRRSPKGVNAVIVKGRKCQVVGNVCMQHCMVDVGIENSVEVGDEATALGSTAENEITALDLASRWGTNPWDVVCGIHPLVPRRYM